MLTALLLLLAAPLAGAAQGHDEARVVHAWIEAARTHEPGVIDRPLVAIAEASQADYRIIGRKLRGTLLSEFRDAVNAGRAESRAAEDRNDILRRGAMLHADIAILLPEQAARFNRSDGGPFYFDLGGGQRPLVSRAPDQLIYTYDGEFRTSAYETGHWWFARLLLRLLSPHPAVDPFAAAWYRAIAAHFKAKYSLGSGRYHLEEGLALLPHDPFLLFYAGARHEAAAAPFVQNVLHPALARQIDLPGPDAERGKAEDLLREAVKKGAPAEAAVRLGRVLGHLGRHEEAATVLRTIAPRLQEPPLQYLCALFLGSEEAALRRPDPAREAFERAASLFPTAQSPLVALADLGWNTGDRRAALDALARMQRLPRSAEREDPWRDYYGQVTNDAEIQLAALRATLAREKEEK